MKPAKEVTIHGHQYAIQVHPYDEGAEIAYELNHSIRAHALEAQKQTANILESLTEAQKKELNALQGDKSKAAELQTFWEDFVASKIDRASMIQVAADFLHSMKPKEMADLTNRLFAHTNAIAHGPLSSADNRRDHFSGNYKTIIPLMIEVIRHNDFLDLDPSDLLQIGQ